MYREIMKPEPPKHHITILFPPTLKDKKDNSPKTEYAIQNKLHKKTHRFQK